MSRNPHACLDAVMFRPGGSSMTKTGFLVALIVTALIVTALVSMPAHAQQAMRIVRPRRRHQSLSVTQPCRTFQQAYNTVAANGEIRRARSGRLWAADDHQGD